MVYVNFTNNSKSGKSQIKPLCLAFLFHLKDLSFFVSSTSILFSVLDVFPGLILSCLTFIKIGDIGAIGIERRTNRKGKRALLLVPQVIYFVKSRVSLMRPTLLLTYDVLPTGK